MAGYVYRGTEHDVKPARQYAGFNPDKCGTTRGYYQHTNYSVPHCDPCRASMAEYVRERKKANA